MLAMPPFHLSPRPRTGILHARSASIKEPVMQLEAKDPVLALEAGQVLVLDDAAGRRISARSGTLWVTEEGEREDRIVEAGHTLYVRHDGRTIVQALVPAWVGIQ